MLSSIYFLYLFSFLYFIFLFVSYFNSHYPSWSNDQMTISFGWLQFFFDRSPPFITNQTVIYRCLLVVYKSRLTGYLKNQSLLLFLRESSFANSFFFYHFSFIRVLSFSCWVWNKVYQLSPCSRISRLHLMTKFLVITNTRVGNLPYNSAKHASRFFISSLAS